VNETDGELMALNAATGQLLWHYHVAGWVVASPVVVDGHLYAASGALYAFGLLPPPPDTTPPTIVTPGDMSVGPLAARARSPSWEGA